MNEDPDFPLQAPSGAAVYRATDGEIILEWLRNSEPNLTGYYVYRKTSGDWMKIDSTADNFYFDDSLSYDTTYFYRITAFSRSGTESGPSREVSAKPENRFKPSRPLFPVINARNWAGDVSVFLSWQRNIETDLAGYNIYRSTISSFTADSSTIIAFIPQSNYLDTVNLSFYTTYFYKIKAVDKGFLESSESSEISDLIFEIPRPVFPNDNSRVNFFNEFMLLSVRLPAEYEIILQSNRFFGEIWSTRVYSNLISDTLKINFDSQRFETNRTYYWRIATYSGNSSEPNSISDLFSFYLKE